MTFVFFLPVQLVDILVIPWKTGQEQAASFAPAPPPPPCTEMTLDVPSVTPSGPYCPGDIIDLTFTGSNLPDGETLDIYLGDNAGFDPFIGDGVLIGQVPINYNCVDCPQLLGIMADPCRDTMAVDMTEQANEFAVMTSGCGFDVDDLSFDINNNAGLNNDDIQTGGNCEYGPVNPALIAQIQSSVNCSASNVFSATGGDAIPAGVIVLIFTDADATTVNYDFSALCATGLDIYVLQNSCDRSIGAFTNGPSVGTVTYGFAINACSDDITYDLSALPAADPDNDHVFILEDGTAVTAIGNCDTPPFASLDYSGSAVDPDTMLFSYTLPDSLCSSFGDLQYYIIGAISASNGCEVSTNATDLEVEVTCLQADVTGSTGNCSELNNGTVAVNVAPYAAADFYFDWEVLERPEDSTLYDGSGGAFQTLSSLPNGTYCVTITDANGCTASDCAVVNATVFTAMATGSVLSCYGDSDGIVAVNPASLSGGLVLGPRYDWDQLETGGNDNYNGGAADDDGATVSGLPAGSYEVTIYTWFFSDTCTWIDTVYITQPDSLEITAVVDTTGCFGADDAAINISVSGGTPSYTNYDWSIDGLGDNDDSEDVSGLGAGSYTVIVTDNNGCTNSATFTIEDGPHVDFNASASYCYGDSVLLYGEWYSSVGTYFDTLPGMAGECDTAVVIDITEDPLINNSVSDSYCFGDSVQVYGVWYYSAGSYQDTVASTTGGCDTAVTITITEDALINNSVSDSYCFGDSVQVYGVWYSSAGSFQDTVVSTTGGCDTAVTITITEDALINSNVSDSYCFGDSVQVYGVWYSAAGSYQDTIASMTGGCDTAVTITITEDALVPLAVSDSYCFGDSVQVYGVWYSSTGTLSGHVDQFNRWVRYCCDHYNNRGSADPSR